MKRCRQESSGPEDLVREATGIALLFFLFYLMFCRRNIYIKSSRFLIQNTVKNRKIFYNIYFIIVTIIAGKNNTTIYNKKKFNSYQE